MDWTQVATLESSSSSLGAEQIKGRLISVWRLRQNRVYANYWLVSRGQDVSPSEAVWRNLSPVITLTWCILKITSCSPHLCPAGSLLYHHNPKCTLVAKSRRRIDVRIYTYLYLANLRHIFSFYSPDYGWQSRSVSQSTTPDFDSDIHLFGDPLLFHWVPPAVFTYLEKYPNIY